MPDTLLTRTSTSPTASDAAVTTTGTDVGSKRALDVNVVQTVGGGSSGGDGAILDGADPSLKATVTAAKALKIDGSAVTQPVSATALPLPSGAATAANQATEISSLSSIDTKLSSLGQKAMTGSVPVVLASDQSSIPVSATAVINTTGSIANNASVTTIAATFTAPANAVGFILEAESGNTDNIRWAVGSTATASVGMLAEPGRDTGYVPLGANISVIAISGTQAISVQWVLR